MLETITYQRCGTLAAPVIHAYRPFTPLQHQIIALNDNYTALLKFFYYRVKSTKNLHLGKFDYAELNIKTGVSKSILKALLERLHNTGMVGTLQKGYSPQTWVELRFDEDTYRAIEALAIY